MAGIRCKQRNYWTPPHLRVFTILSSHTVHVFGPKLRFMSLAGDKITPPAYRRLVGQRGTKRRRKIHEGVRESSIPEVPPC